MGRYETSSETCSDRCGWVDFAVHVATPARATFVLVSGPNRGSFTNNYGFGANGMGTTVNPDAT